MLSLSASETIKHSHIINQTSSEIQQLTLLNSGRLTYVHTHFN